MKLELFGTLLVFLSLSKSIAVFPDCDYFDTVDLSHIKMRNDSYEYDGVVIPKNLTGEYDIMRMSYPGGQSVTKQLRGCFCKQRPCVRVCCPRKHMLAHGGCSDGFKDQLTRVNLYLNVTREDDSIEALNINNLTLLRTPFWQFDETIGINGDEYTLYEDGTLFLHSDKMRWTKDEYCLYPHNSYSDFPETIWIVLQQGPLMQVTGINEIKVISMIGCILTIAVYLYVKKLRNVLGKSLICSIFVIFMRDFFWLLDDFSLLKDFCSLAGHSSYFADIAFNIWLSVISYHLWNTLTSLNRHEPPNRFLTYSIFVWGTASIPTGFIFLINQVWEKDLYKWNWMPLVGLSECSVEFSKWSAWIYYYGPLLILNMFGLVMFILTARHILKVRKELKKVTRRRDGTTTCFNFDSEAYLLFLRLSVIMGVSWILDLISLLEIPIAFVEVIITITKYFHCGFGIVVFVVLILRRSTIELLMNRIRNRK